MLNKAGQMHRKLIQNLFKNYEPLERPVQNETDSLVVNFGINIQQILEIVTIFLNISFITAYSIILIY